ncbi:MAG: NADH:flavin oxidoreductase/NADH oxidase [Elusimicrobia bacterium]|nr:NADH:flavin oxidoreductase/NADH oxidase [Elusimicrobiota bacterium]
MSKLFTPLTLRGVTVRNRIFMSPMCQYSCTDGLAEDWHLVHLGSRAVGGAGLVVVEATGVCPEGRISPGDLGLWSARHAEALLPVARFIKSQGAVPCAQIAHAGRKASTARPWDGGGPVAPEKGGWQPLAPSPLPFDKGYAAPKEMTLDEISQAVSYWERAARLALEAGFEALELHFAHGYLVQSFLSPLSNRRTDAYGGSLEGRMRLALELTERVRRIWPERLPLLARVSATDWMEGGWDLGQTIVLARALKERGVDLLDCSSGGGFPQAQIPAGPDFQVPFAEAVRRETGLPTGAVGFITEPAQAEAIVASGRADAVLLARQFLREPYWPLRAAKELGVEGPWPKQYLRAKA